MESHSALSGKIVEEVGFKGIWGSGLSISTAMGFRDNNEASWSQILDVAEQICDSTEIPMLLDADTGYGNFNNARMLVKKLENRGVAAVCVEDKLFPKKNSFIQGECQSLSDIDEFCGKIKAMKDAQTDPNFTIIARTEAFITGSGISEVFKRAEAYYKAGADGLFIHSKKNDASEVFNFMKEWKDTCPVIISPTTYSHVKTEEFENHGISIVIWANHLIRASIKAMQEIAKKIIIDGTVKNIEKDIVSLDEIFRLVNMEELNLAEQKYLPVYKGCEFKGD